MLRSEGISPRKAPKLSKVIAAHNSIMTGLKHSHKKTRKNVIKSSSLSKYGYARYVSSSLGVHRRLFKEKAQRAISKRKVKMGLQCKAVASFMMRSDNSTCCPGKRDFVKVGKERKQKYILNDTLENLRMKYLQENPNKSISYATFCRMRPKNILTVRYLSRKVCLCQKHQNIALKLRALRNVGVSGLPLRPDNLLEFSAVEVKQHLETIQEEHVKFQEWRKVKQPYKDGVISKTTLVEDRMVTDKFVEGFVKEFLEFSRHAYRVIEQYEQVRLLKQTMPKSHVTVQIDFAENYVCHFGEEVQSAYYSKEQVTVHPAVVHFKKTVEQSDDQPGSVSPKVTEEIQHKSFVIISDETSHTSGTVYAFMRSLVPKIKEIVPNVDTIHYISDSPTSQYRNLNMFNITTHHQELFNVNATWQYFESGHGKGPCDGVGGSVKRSADLAVRMGTLIKTADDLYNWGSQRGSAVEFLMVNKELIKQANEDMLALDAISVHGTLKFHSVMPVQSGEAYFRETSCFRLCCWREGIFSPTCREWEKKFTRKQHVVDTRGQVSDPQQDQMTEEPERESVHQPEIVTQQPQASEDSRPTPYTGYVVVLYEGKTYIGQIMEFDEDDEEYYVRFMEKTGKCPGVYKWPYPPDELWLHHTSIVTSIDEPTPTGKSKRLFKLSEKDMSLMLL